MEVAFSALRGERVTLDDGILVINDCYNANPMSMRAALDDLAATAPGRRVAVLGDMLELGDDAGRYHAEVGSHAAARGVDVLVTVGELAVAMAGAFGGESYPVADAAEAAAMLPELLQPGDTVLVKASRGVGLEVVAEALARRNRARRPGGAERWGAILIARHRGDADLHLPHAQVHLVPARARVRPEHPRGGPEGHHDKAGTPTMGGIIIFTWRSPRRS